MTDKKPATNKMLQYNNESWDRFYAGNDEVVKRVDKECGPDVTAQDARDAVDARVAAAKADGKKYIQGLARDYGASYDEMACAVTVTEETFVDPKLSVFSDACEIKQELCEDTLISKEKKWGIFAVPNSEGVKCTAAIVESGKQYLRAADPDHIRDALQECRKMETQPPTSVPVELPKIPGGRGK